MIEVNHLSYSYDRKEILRDLTFSVAEGSFTAILGANGCGKTTLLRIVSGLLPSQHGSVIIDGTPVDQYTARQRAQKIAIVKQHSQTDIDFSAFETVLMGRNPYQRHLQNESQEDWDIVERALRQTNTWHLRLALPSQMSGGELQRVMIARALAQQTPILLLDEPTSNLDIAHQFEIMELLTEINRKEGKTILIVVHDLNLALRYCPQALLLHDHSLLFHGATSEALTPERIHTAFGVNARNTDGYIRLERIQ
ncbi:MAG: ABC transporter ATP-binding protein [Bacteroidales bacterium]|nr:ABC transporter ATP-binding protein [Bacteroidales bacterium]